MSVDFRVALVAYLIGAEGKRQTEIAQIFHELDITPDSEPAISRFAKQAVAAGILKQSTTYVKKDVPDKIQEQVKDVLDSRRLKELLYRVVAKAGKDVAVESVRVFDSNGSGIDEREWNRRAGVFGEGAAGFAANFILRSETTGIVGIGWGRTVAAVVRRVAAKWKNAPPQANLTFIPISGEILGGDPGPASSTTLARLLHKALYGETKKFLSLAGIPALIPKRFTQIGPILEFLNSCENYTKVLNRKTGLVNQMNSLIVSVGSSRGMFNEEMLRGVGKAEELKDEMHRLFVGDICGVVVTRKEMSQQNENSAKKKGKTTASPDIQDWFHRWLGYQREHLEKVAKAASPGVLAIAFSGRDPKAEVLLSAIRLGLINALAIDRVLENQLIKLAEEYLAED